MENFQLLEIDFPTEYNLAISDTQNEQLKIELAKNGQDKVLEELEGLKNKIGTEKEIIKTNYLVNTIKDVTLIKQNKISLTNFVGQAGTYYLEKKAIYGIEELAKSELEEAFKKAFDNGGHSDRYTYMLESPTIVSSLVNK